VVLTRSPFAGEHALVVNVGLLHSHGRGIRVAGGEQKIGHAWEWEYKVAKVINIAADGRETGLTKLALGGWG
jgi:hypothetical protein